VLYWGPVVIVIVVGCGEARASATAATVCWLRNEQVGDAASGIKRVPSDLTLRRQLIIDIRSRYSINWDSLVSYAWIGTGYTGTFTWLSSRRRPTTQRKRCTRPVRRHKHSISPRIIKLSQLRDQRKTPKPPSTMLPSPAAAAAVTWCSPSIGLCVISYWKSCARRKHCNWPWTACSVLTKWRAQSGNGTTVATAARCVTASCAIRTDSKQMQGKVNSSHRLPPHHFTWSTCALPISCFDKRAGASNIYVWMLVSIVIGGVSTYICKVINFYTK